MSYKDIPCVFYILYKILTTFKLAVIAPAIVVTCPTPNGPFCNINVELALVTFTRSVFEMAGSITTVDVVTFCIKLPVSCVPFNSNLTDTVSFPPFASHWKYYTFYMKCIFIRKVHL